LKHNYSDSKATAKIAINVSGEQAHFSITQ